MLQNGPSEGLATHSKPQPEEQAFGKGVYFIGKVLWAKGYTELLDRLKEHTARTGINVPVDVYGSGPDLQVRDIGACDKYGMRRRIIEGRKGSLLLGAHMLASYLNFIMGRECLLQPPSLLAD